MAINNPTDVIVIRLCMERILDREHIIFLSKAVRNICLLPIHFNFTVILLSEFDVEDFFFVDDEGILYQENN